MQCILSALKAESTPFINYFKLKKIDSFPSPLYQNNNLSLLIVGVGKGKIEKTISEFCKYYETKKLHFFNIGISGGNPETSKIGKMYIINKIVDDETGRHFYPDILVNNKIEENCITTVNENIIDGGKNYKNLVDMEASEIFKSCIKRVPTHQISFLKIVSDYMGEETLLLNEQKIKQLIIPHIDLIQLQLVKSKKLQEKIKPLLHNSDLDWVGNTRLKLRLTETQYYKLLSLCKRYRLKNPLIELKGISIKKRLSKKERNQKFSDVCKFLEA